MDIEDLKQRTPEDRYDLLRLLHGSKEDEQMWHDYLDGIARRLMKGEFDFDKYPIRFCITDDNTPNAAFVRPNQKNDIDDESDEERRLTQENNYIPIIFVTKGLLNMVENEDQLAFILGHELSHMQEHFFNQDNSNSKLEEMNSDFRSLERLVKAGYNINEARRMASHIFTNESMYADLSSKLARALDDHPNNESRLNAIDIKIKSIEDDYQKQNIDINNYEPQPVTEEIIDNIAQRKHITRFQLMLNANGYQEASLKDKQDILLSTLTEYENYIDPHNPYHYIEPLYTMAIEDVLCNYVAELRRQMPRKIISQSDYDLLGGLPSNYKEEWERITGTKYEGYVSSISLLEHFPYKIVPDEEFAAQTAIEAEKQKEFQASLDNGTNLNVIFWDKICNFNTGTHLSVVREKTQRICGTILNGLEHIDLTQVESGRRILEQLTLFAEDNLDSREIEYLPTYDNYANDNNDNHMPNDLKFHEHDRNTFPFKRFDPTPFPTLGLQASTEDIGKKLPKSIMLYNSGSNVEYLFGTEHHLITKDIMCVSYNPSYQTSYADNNDDRWCYFANKEGVIIDSFPAGEYENKVQQIKAAAEKKVYMALAEKIKEYHKILKQLEQNPYDTSIPLVTLSKIKELVGPYDVYNGGGISNVGIYRELCNDRPEHIRYKTQFIRDFFQHDFYEEKEKNNIYIDFDVDKLSALLTPEEQDLISPRYDNKRDNLVFNAYLNTVISTNESRWKPYINDYGKEYSSSFQQLTNQLHKFSTYWSNHQVITFYQEYFAKKSDIDIDRDFSFDATVLTELKHLTAFILQEQANNTDIQIKDIDFRKYQPLYADHIAKHLNLPSDFSSISGDLWDWRISNFYSHHAQIALLRYILTDETHNLPLQKVDRYLSYLQDVVKEKFPPFLLKRENYPADTIEAVKTFKALPSGVMDYKQTASFIIDIIKQEQDPKKALTASLSMVESINHSILSVSEKDQLKNTLLDGSSAFNVPLHERISAYQQLSEQNGFAEDYTMQNAMLKSFIPEIETIGDIEERIAYYDIFINKQHRISDPDLRRQYQQLWVDSVFKACGSKTDDNSPELYNKVKRFADYLNGSYLYKPKWQSERMESNVNLADRIEIARALADKFVSQQEMSLLIRPEPQDFATMDSGNRNNSHFKIAGFDFIKSILNDNPKEADTAINFLLSKGNSEDCKNYSQHLKEVKDEQLRRQGWNNIGIAEVTPETLQVMYREFWGYPLEARAVIINELLHSASQRSDGEKWEMIFDKVADRVFPNAGEQMGKIGREFLHSYIKARKDSERTLYLAAMMVAANENSETTDPEKSIAKGIRLFLENSGPAAIKLGQAMASYTDVPKFIRDEMQQLKSSAARPSRWELYEWLDFYKKEAGDTNLQYGKDVWLGKILGSASYFVTLEKGAFENGKIPLESDKVVKILRAGAKISSDKEFKIFETMLLDLAEKGVMTNGVDSFMRLVKQAKDSVKIETDLNIGHDQLETAKQLYKEKEIEVDGHKFKLHVADWPEYGDNWADLERAKGTDLDRIKDPNYKRAVSKAYFTVELMNMVSGGRFDHDRHGKQLKIDTENNVIGLFDTGAMAVVDPDPKDKELLGKIIYKTLEKTMQDNSPEGSFGKVGAILSSEIEKVYNQGETSSTYLTECQRGLLALTDFYKDFGAKDFIDCFNSAINNKDMPLDKHLMQGFIKEGIKSVGIFESEQSLLSYKDKEQLGSLIFNVYASGFKNDGLPLGETIQKEIAKMKMENNDNMPLLDIISSKLSDTQSASLGLNFPKEFMPTVSEIISHQNIDTAILKGVMKEVVYTVDLQNQKNEYSAQDRQEFGRLLYATCDTMIKASRQGQKLDMAETFLNLQKTSGYQSNYAAKVAAVITLAKAAQFGDNAESLNLNTMVKSVLLAGRMDKEITKGITDALREANPNSLTRPLMAKGLELFLSQKQAEPSLLKKALVRIVVKHKNPIGQLQGQLTSTIENPNNRRKLVTMMQGYADKFSRLIKQQPQDLKIKIQQREY